MAFEKLVSFTKDVSDLADRPSLGSAAALKAQFDAAPDEVRVYLNKLIDALKSTATGDSGAKNIGVTTIEGVTGTDVQTVLEQLAKKQETWQNLNLIENWVNTGGGFETAQFKKDKNGFVHVKGVIQNGKTANGSWIGVLPAGYRPQEAKIFSTYTAWGSDYNGNAILRINTDGSIVIQANVQSGQLALNVPLFEGV